MFGETLGRVAARAGAMELVLPTVPHLLARVREGTAGWPVRPRIIVEQAEKWAAFRSARAALAASGTVTLELALAGVPTVAAYRLDKFEGAMAALIRLRARLPSLILANLVIGENVVPELLQEDCTVDKLTAALLPLVSDTRERRRQVDGFARLDGIMGIALGASQETSTDAISNSAKAADIVLTMARRGRAPD